MNQSHLTGAQDLQLDEDIRLSECGFEELRVKTSKTLKLERCSFQHLQANALWAALDACTIPHTRGTVSARGGAVQVNGSKIESRDITIRNSMIGVLNLETAHSDSDKSSVFIEGVVGRTVNASDHYAVTVKASRIKTLSLKATVVHLDGAFDQVLLAGNTLLGDSDINGASEINVEALAPLRLEPVHARRVRCSGQSLRWVTVGSGNLITLSFAKDVTLESVLLEHSKVTLESSTKTDQLRVKGGLLTAPHNYIPPVALSVADRGDFTGSHLSILGITALAGAQITLKGSRAKDVAFRLNAGSSLTVDSVSTLEGCTIFAHPGASIETPTPVNTYFDGGCPTGLTLSECATYRDTSLPNGFTLNSGIL